MSKHRADFYSRLSLRERTPERYFRGAKGDTYLPQDAKSQRFMRGLGCVTELAALPEIGKGSTVIIPQGSKPLAGGWSGATTA